MNETGVHPVSGVLKYAALIVLAILFLIPIVFIAFTSLKSNADLMSHPVYSLPQKVHWDNFLKAWNQGRMSMYMKNTVIICLIKVPLGILIEALAAFALTRMNFKWGNSMFTLFLVGMMIPMQATLVPLNIFLNKTHLVSTYPGIILVYVGFGIPFGILILRGFFRTIPKELDEAALIDGCGDMGKFFRVIIPLAMPAIATLVIFDFMATWNEFLLAQIFITKDSMKTITTGLLAFRGEHMTDYTLLNAAVLISIIPIFAVYLTFQKYFVNGLAGSVKG
ncbi:carbohydrate ABC transporter permease [Paenibacillus aceris]|uniref:Raffinose/stachyose/melibiose transport system permease protein n=1 Tax=Paenibacillus aceris TaxID=869555 RepID=A0ABS4I3I3_9BACL|nr:carbohydrate ABC transporter permease [Paenibacillus aceris]MBP1965497.1 raffinose/stachyose/melibiose transport system permease protein [Paenibacillus aceris]NHW33454.1 carbohydrate ABC transporter permease [Paenibacillus aceris]